MRWRRKLVALSMVIVLLGLVLCPTGCWDRLEPDLLGVITIAAFDIDEELGLFKVYAQMDNPLGGSQQQNGGGGGSSGQGKSTIWFVEATGHTIFEAITNMELNSTRRLLWSHVKVILFSERLARKGIKPVLDFLDRERQIRLISQPFIVEGDLQQLLKAEFPLELEGGEAMGKQSFSIVRESSTLSEVDSLLRVYRHLSAPGIEINMHRIKIIVDEKMEAEKEPAGKPNPVQISGIGVFQGDRFVGFLDDKETAGYNWLTGNMHLHNLILQCPNSENGYLTVEVFESSVKLTPEFRGDKVRFKAAVFAGGRLQDYACPTFPLEQQFIDSLNSRMAAVIRNEIVSSLEKARELESDIFGLGRIIYRTRYKEWQRIGDNWPNIFPNVPVDIEIKASILRHGLVLQPVEIK